MFRVLTASLLLLFFLPPMTCGGHSPDQISSVGVSPDDKFIAVDFVKGKRHLFMSLPWTRATQPD